MNCRKCRAEIPNDAKFCPYCGVMQSKKKNVKARGNGQGSVYQLPNKSWIAIKTTGYYLDEEGKMHRKTRSKSGFKTKKEAVLYLAQLEAESAPKKYTFLQVFDMWAPQWENKKIFLSYKSLFLHFKAIHNRPISEISIDELQRCVDNAPLGKGAKSIMKTLAGLLYKYAIPRRITDLNVAQYIIIRHEESRKKPGFTVEELKKIESNIGNVKGADIVYCHCYLGFRPGELLSLTTESYDPVNKTLRGGSKTEAGKNRVVPISPKIQPIIENRAAKIKQGYIFGDDKGEKVSEKVYTNMFYHVLKDCGINDETYISNSGNTMHVLTPHSCRHTFATLMKRVQGGNLTDMLALIGHTDESMLREYQDSPIEDLRKIIDKM